MSIVVQWDNQDKTVIRCEFVSVWTWQDLFAMNQNIRQLMSIVSHKVYLIVMMNGYKLPSSGMLTYTKDLFVHDHPNYAKHIIFVDAHVLVKTFERIIRKAYVQSMTEIQSNYVDTLVDARRLTSSIN